MKDYGLAIYEGGIELHMDQRTRRRGPRGRQRVARKGRRGPSKRGVIQGFTEGSERRLAWALATARVGFEEFLTLTYHAKVDEEDSEEAGKRNELLVKRAKGDLNRFLSAVRGRARHYVWTQEFQKRGAIHFHVLVERGLGENLASLAWCRATGQLDDPQAMEHAVQVRAVESEIAARRYLVKYFRKSGQRVLPAGVRRAGRYWGCSRGLITEALVRVVSCANQGARHDRAALQVMRGVKRFLQRELDFAWPGGRLQRWKGDLPQRAIKVAERLCAYYGDVSSWIPLLEEHGWEVVEVEEGLVKWD